MGLNMFCFMMSRIESSHAKDLTPFQDVRLGPLVGKGSFGKVYRGIWDNIIVAIKVTLL
jgi:serine/threonine protein kinase